MLSPPSQPASTLNPGPCGPETLRQWPPRRFPSSTKPSLGPWDLGTPPAHHPNREKGQDSGPSTTTLNRLVPRLDAPCFLSFPLLIITTTTIVLTRQTQPTSAHHLAAGGPNPDPRFTYPPVQPLATLSAHRKPRRFSNPPSPKIVLVATHPSGPHSRSFSALFPCLGRPYKKQPPRLL